MPKLPALRNQRSSLGISKEGQEHGLKENTGKFKKSWPGRSFLLPTRLIVQIFQPLVLNSLLGAAGIPAANRCFREETMLAGCEQPTIGLFRYNVKVHSVRLRGVTACAEELSCRQCRRRPNRVGRDELRRVRKIAP
jgi:hypothetical protein